MPRGSKKGESKREKGKEQEKEQEKEKEIGRKGVEANLKSFFTVVRRRPSQVGCIPACRRRGTNSNYIECNQFYALMRALLIPIRRRRASTLLAWGKKAGKTSLKRMRRSPRGPEVLLIGIPSPARRLS